MYRRKGKVDNQLVYHKRPLLSISVRFKANLWRSSLDDSGRAI